MLSPDKRLTLLDALRPPPGFGIDRAIGTTYSLDLQALLTAPAAFALVQAMQSDEQDLAPIELLDSIRRHAGRILMFCQGGQIALPAQTRLLPFLETCVVPVRAPRKGVFHPKVWVLRFVSNDGQDRRYRLLCASRNLTFDRSWDTVLQLDQVDLDHDGVVLDGLVNLVTALPRLAIQPLGPEQSDNIAEIAKDLRQIRFAPPAGVKRMEFHAIGIAGARPSFSFPAQFSRLLIFSPFLDAGFLARIPSTPTGSAIVSRPESMDEVGATALMPFDESFVLSPDANPVVDEGHGADPSAPPEDPNWPLTGLHAKLYVFEDGQEARVYTGSANATTAAFERNVEALVELRGPRALLGVEAFMGAPEGEVSFHSLLVPYLPASDYGTPAPISSLDLLRREIGCLAFTGLVTSTDFEDTYYVRYKVQGAVPVPPDITVRCWPVTLSPASARDLVLGAGTYAAEFLLSLDHLTGFLGIEIHGPDGSTSFVVPVLLEGVPEDRASRLLRLLIGSTARLLAYLLMLLSDEESNRYDIAELIARLGRTEGAPGDSLGLPLIESMLAALRRDPERLQHVQRLVTDLRASEEGLALLPEGFDAIWDSIWLVAQELGN